MSYYCHECGQRRDIVYNPLSCAMCGSDMIDSIPIVNEESSEDEELQEFFSEIDFYYNALAREQVYNFSTFDHDDDQEDDDQEAALEEERCLFEQLSSMYNHPLARNFTSTSTSTHPFPAISTPDSPPTVYRHRADQFYQELYQDNNDDDEEEEVTEDEDILAYHIGFEQGRINDNTELERPDADGTESLFQLPLDRFGSLLDAMYSYRSDDDDSDDDSVEGESNYHRRSFLDNLADILSVYTSDHRVRQQQTPTTPTTIVDAIVKSLKKSCLDSSDPVAHDACIICQEVYGTSIDIFQLPCQHKYHGTCITKWFSVNTSCPICRHPADKQQQQQQQEHEQPSQTIPLHSTPSTTSTDSSISVQLPSSSSTSFPAARTNVFDIGGDQYETDTEESETAVYDVSHIQEETDGRDEVCVTSFERPIISSGLSPSTWDMHGMYGGGSRTMQHNQEEADHRNVDSDQESMGGFERSITSILSPQRTVDTISSATPSNRYFHSPTNPMNEFISHQFQASRSRSTGSLYDDNNALGGPAVIDWWYNSSMEEVD